MNPTPNRDLLSEKRPWITDGAFQFLCGIVKPNWSAFEWGMGGSTTFLLDACRTLVSVEHNAEWFKKVSQAVLMTDAAWRPNVPPPWTQVLLPPHPLGTSRKLSIRGNGCFESYVHAIYQYATLGTLDFVLVDGRARNECVRHAIAFVKPGGWLALDNSDREDYASAVAMLSRWKRHDFAGHGPLSDAPWRTTFWLKP